MVNKHFAIIYQTYLLYGDALTHGDSNEQNLEFISERHTYNLIRKYSNKSLGPDDFPRQIMV